MRILCLLVLLLVAPPVTAAEDLTGEHFPYAAFDRLERTVLEAEGSRIEVAFGPGEWRLERPQMLDWIKRSARAIGVYYGRFPVGRLRLLILPRNGARVMFGQAFGDDGAAVRIFLGTEAGEAALTDDWILVHEMVHLAFPRLFPRHNWLAEGLAVYVESIARVQSGDLTEEEIWRGFLRGIPQGLPQAGDRGLDNTPTWGRTYWGGALFCMLADIEIRKRTANRIGLQQALQGVLAEVNFESRWPIVRALQVADRSIGLDVLMGLYERMRSNPESADLETLWKDLGVVEQGRTVVFDASAPAAAIRAAIVAKS
jgi:hypothetical protein